MSAMRAKFKVTKIERVSETFENLTLAAVSEKPFDPDGKSDDNDFARWTPNGNLTMSVSNPSLIGKFKEGQKFYLDFIEAAE